MIADANYVALIVAVAVPLGVKIRGSNNVPVPDHVPPEVALDIVIFTCPVGPGNIGYEIVEFVNPAFGKWSLENELVEILNKNSTTNACLNEVFNFCKQVPLRIFIKNSLLKKALYKFIPPLYFI